MLKTFPEHCLLGQPRSSLLGFMSHRSFNIHVALLLKEDLRRLTLFQAQEGPQPSISLLVTPLTCREQVERNLFIVTNY
jgi:hypothetical protein